jgi:hypothetical protein
MITISRDISFPTPSYKVMVALRTMILVGLAAQAMACGGFVDSVSDGQAGSNSLVAPKTSILAPTAVDKTAFSLAVGESKISLPYVLQVDLGSSWTDDVAIQLQRANDQGVFVAFSGESDWQVVQDNDREVWSTTLRLGPGRYRIATRLQLLAEDSGAMVSYQATTRAIEIMVNR